MNRRPLSPYHNTTYDVNSYSCVGTKMHSDLQRWSAKPM